MKNEQLKVTPVATIQTRIFNIRGVHVMIDKDLSNLYGVETKVLNQAVKRNIERFPEDFMFQLTKEECSRSQIVTLNIKQGENIKYLPYAFTELGIAMLSGILRSPIAIQVNINILRAFVEMRKQMKVLTENTLQIENLRLELQNQKAYIEEILHDQNDCNELMQAQLDALTDSMTELSVKVNSLTQTVKKPRKPVGFVIPDTKE
ncbi:MAG: ORF6N domain-containing protein [Bacteroidales bacterium]|nr:ORF6N domain-containing protein [Bacteroidales bacterium]